MLLRFLLKSYDFALLHIIAEESRYLYCCILPSHSKGVRVLWLAQVNNENLFFTPLSMTIVTLSLTIAHTVNCV